MKLGDYRTWLERITLLGGRVRACCSSAGKGNWSIALHRGRGSCTRSSGPLYTIVVRSYKVSDVARSVHAVSPGNRAAITLATTRFLHTCTMIPLKICSSQAVEKGQTSGGVDSQFVLTWHVLCETERPRLAADLAQQRGPDGEVHGCATLLLSKVQGFVHELGPQIARLACQSIGEWIGQLHATRSKPLVRDQPDTGQTRHCHAQNCN